MDDKCLEWRERGVRCECIRRSNRQGYKAGALKEARVPSCHTASNNQLLCQQIADLVRLS